MAHRTRCQECENFTERREMYQDICVPVKRAQADMYENEDGNEMF